MYRYLLPLLLVIPGCASITEPETEPTLVGPIVALDLQLALVRDKPNIHVRPTDDNCGIVFAVDEQTTIRTVDGQPRGTLEDLTVGRKVRVWSSGVISMSCPAQAGADIVELFE